MDDDEDGIPDLEDKCPRVNSQDNNDRDGDGAGDVCDDSDHDGLTDAIDGCPDDYDPGQVTRGAFPIVQNLIQMSQTSIRRTSMKMDKVMRVIWTMMETASQTRRTSAHVILTR